MDHVKILKSIRYWTIKDMKRAEKMADLIYQQEEPGEYYKGARYQALLTINHLTALISHYEYMRKDPDDSK